MQVHAISFDSFSLFRGVEAVAGVMLSDVTALGDLAKKQPSIVVLSTFVACCEAILAP